MNREEYTFRTGLIHNENNTGNIGSWVVFTHIETGKQYFGIGESQILARDNAIKLIKPTPLTEEVESALHKNAHIVRYSKEWKLIKSHITQQEQRTKELESKLQAYYEVVNRCYPHDCVEGMKKLKQLSEEE